MGGDSKKRGNVLAYGLSEDGKPVRQHPWALSRGDRVLTQLKNKNIHNIADIGVNDMFHTKKASAFAKGTTYAVDVFFPESGLEKDGIRCLNSIEKLPDNDLDGIIMMDVLEHIEDDTQFFNTAVSKLRDNGLMLITVPAWQFLFSAHDRWAQHYRRYDRKQLLALLKHDEIEVEKCHYFYTSLFFARLMFLFGKDKFDKNDIAWKYSEKNIITQTVKLVLDIDFWLNGILDKIRIHLPGLSLVALCKKVKSDD